MYGIPIFVYAIVASLITIAWIVLPFAVFGLKGRADRVIEELKAVNENLYMLRKEIANKGGSHSEDTSSFKAEK
ncbi:hypothetical protein JK628_07425 [Shewanella sp. KX20019]|uniref:hypothetical protein n=1 Tax=Shewanella sp. KX20019 TaxID=2803864 RepID=UPI001926BC64|nr:hypothetical protein [Shewanella sp. KX20019]QQX81660.1 hypothetical protein JK628_07425 [Shewanella sp. KX20019]